MEVLLLEDVEESEEASELEELLWRPEEDLDVGEPSELLPALGEVADL